MKVHALLLFFTVTFSTAANVTRLLHYAPQLVTMRDTEFRLSSASITSTIFMLRSDSSSPLYDLFALHEKAIQVCDKDTKSDGCDIRLEHNYNYDTLSNKLVDTLNYFCSSNVKTDFYVKIDDDVIMAKSTLDKILAKMATTKCQVAGTIAVDYSYYWPEGQIYIIKREMMDDICAKLPTFIITDSHEDRTIGQIWNSTERDKFCGLDWPKNHWHKSYSDNRVIIQY